MKKSQLRHTLRAPSIRCRTMLLAFVGVTVLGTVSTRADLASINQSVWKMQYGVTDAQLGDTNWLNADADGDGGKNGAELAAGTNPFVAGSVVKITNITATETTVSLTFPAQKGKRYDVQGAPDLTTFADLDPAVFVNAPSSSNRSLVAPKGTNKFFRVLVQDIDTDSDGVSNWAEGVTGYDPNSAMTNGSVNDATALTGALAVENIVSIRATDSTALQPEGGNAPVDVGQITVSRSGTLHFADVVVPLSKSGTAVEGADYNSLPATVMIPKNSASVVLEVMPAANAALRTNRVATFGVMPGGGYTVASPSSASVAINPAGTANGTGLTAVYHNTSSSTYATQQTIFAGAAEMARTDAVVDFGTSANTIVASIAVGNPCVVTTTRATALATGDTVTIAGVTGGTFSPSIVGTYPVTVINGTSFTVPVNCTAVPTAVTSATLTAANGWNTAAGPTGLSPVSTTGAYSVRWTGQILPQYSETYTIDFRSDDGAKVWINGVLLIDRWSTQSANDYTNTIALQAGIPYDIQIEYFNNGTGNAEAKLYWWSASQVKQIIPQSRLFPAPLLAAKFTAITSALSAVGYVSVPFSFSLTSPNIGGGTTYAVAPTSAPLPPGLALNSTTGVISGTPTTAGSYNVAVNATNTAAGVITGSSIIDFTILPAGSVTRETLAGAVSTADGSIPTIDDDTDYADNTSRRLRGYIVPPKTGNYYFWLAANNTAEFWLSNDAESINVIRRSVVTASTGKKDWNFLDTPAVNPTSRPQMTQWLSLVAGQKYYFEVLHNTGTDADDYVALGWCQDDVGTVVAVTGAPNGAGMTPSIPDGGAARQGYPYSGTVPSYVCQPYDYPTVASSTGTLYAANLGPQGSSTTKASGSANLRMDASGNSAVLHFYYSGLSSPRTGYHIHVDAFDTHPAGEIIFDIDDIDAFHPELKTADGGYIWNFETVGTFTSIQQIRDAVTQGKAYLNVHSVNYPNGEIRGTLGLVDGSQTPPDPALYAAPPASDVNTNDANAARFLNQATFGASPTDIAFVKANGFEAWINDQLTKPSSRSSNDVVAGVGTDINNLYPSSLFTNAWWKYSITGPDQLRQRLAFALSEIMVISWANNSGPLQNNGRILADYYDQLVDYCLPTAGLTDSGNFRGILKQVTLTPAMGLYLDMRGNQKGDDTIGRHPNENYAREIMQLFSIGLNRMWDDGRFIIDSNANLVPTYTQPSIIGLSKLLTGWTYAQALQGNGRLPTNFGPAADYLNAMVLVPTQHELRYQKLLLNNVVTPAATGITPRVTLSTIGTGSPCTVNTATVHGLQVGDTVTISNVTGGTFSVPINGAHLVTEIVDGDSFKVGSNCTVVPTAYTNAAVTGTTVTPAAISGTGGVVAAVTGSQADNSLFSGWTLPHPYDQYGLKELETAMNNIFSNDNVPPYICRLLIQRLVTSDPSPGYVYRVVQKFKNNGSGVRGDLAAVVKQILLDGEARSTTAAFANNAFGKQREPMLRVTGPARAFPANRYSGTYEQLSGVNSNKLRIVTSGLNDFSSGFSVALDFRGNYTTTSPPSPYTNPTSTTYAIGSTTAIAATHLDISSISATGVTPTAMSCTQPHGMGAIGQTRTIWLFGLSGKFSDASINSGGKTATVTGPNSFTVTASATHVFQIASVAVGSPCVVTTAAPHGLPAGTTSGVTINGVNGGTFSTAINGTTMKVINTGANTFTVTTSADVPINCTVAPTSYTTWRQSSNPARVTTQVPHGLANGDSVTISGVTGGSFTPTINGTYVVSEVAASAFTLAGVSANSPSNANTGNIVGANTLDVNATGMVNAAYTQAAGSNVLTVSTGGPPTNVTVPGTTVNITSIAVGNPCTVTTSAAHNLVNGGVVSIAGVLDGTFGSAITGTFVPTVTGANTFTVPVDCSVAAATGTTTKLIRSRVYLDFLTQTTAGGAALPADGVFDVLSVNGSTSFTFITADTPVTARGGNVLLPKLTSSYTPSGTIIQYNNNVNHNMLVGQNVWVDVPTGVASPVTDAEYTITETSDEDHFKTSRTPASTNGGVYPNPSGSNNGITIYPLVPPPLGRTGNVVINQSTFNLGSTESTLSQSPLNAPTVFNFFFPDYKFPGTLSNSGVDSPEFQLSTDTNLSNLTNSVTNMFIGTGGGNSNLNGLSSFNNGNGTVVADIGPFMVQGKTANAGIPALIDELAGILIGGPLEASTKTTIQNFVSNTTYFPYTSPTPTNQQMRDRVRAIIHLILTSAEYAVQK